MAKRADLKLRLYDRDTGDLWRDTGSIGIFSTELNKGKERDDFDSFTLV